MAHEMIEGLDTAMYGSNKAAWHGLGTVVEGRKNSQDCIRLSGLDWDVFVAPCLGWPAPPGGQDAWLGQTQPEACEFPLSSGKTKKLWRGAYEVVPGVRATYRVIKRGSQEYRYWFGAVGSGYTPIQNRDAFRIADRIVGKGKAAYETAGSLKGGRMVYITAVMDTSMQVKDDLVGLYLLFTTSHDMSLRFTILPTPIRVVCRNTQLAAMDTAAWQLSFKHTLNAQDRIVDAAADKVLKRSAAYFNGMGTVYDLLASIDVNDRFARDYVERLIPLPEKKQKAAKGRRDRILGLFHGGQDGAKMDAVKGTAYGLWTAATQFQTHEMRTVRREDAAGDKPSEEEARFNSDLWGTGAAFRERSFDLLAEMTDVDASGTMKEALAVAKR